ncbi:MAG: LCP family protein [Ruminococcus sp.]|nr:LCP family protein [Ruminococcus sp.]
MTNEHNDDMLTPEVEETSEAVLSDNTQAELPADDVDDYVFAHYRHHGGKHYSKKSSHGYSDSDNQEVVRSHSEQHFRHRKKLSVKDKNWNNRSWWQKLLIILAWIFGVILALILIAAIAFLVLRYAGIVKLTDYENLDMTAPVIENANVSVTDKGHTVIYNGKEYTFNTDMTSILCIGVDKDELGIDGGTGGQSDALYMIALDTVTGKTRVIAIPRDIVTDIGIYSTEGEYLKTEKHQLCLAYAYGDGRKTSCLNTTTAVSRLFYQLPINSYFAVNVNAVPDLNDAVGGVTIAMIDDSFYDTNLVRHYTGETITLYGEDAIKYVRQREVAFLSSSTDRLNRQVTYLKAFTAKALEMTKQDLTTPVTLYNIVAENSETNLTPSTITAFATSVVTNGISELDFVTVPGELVSTGTYAEYIVDEEALYELILDTYYTTEE